MKVDLLKGKVSTRIKGLAIPASIGFFFSTMFNVVDTYFAGFISSEALASVSITFPVFMFLISVGLGIGTAVTTLLGNAIGEGRGYDHILYQAFSLCLVSGILIPLLGFLSFEQIYGYLGASGTYLEQARDYSLVLYCGSIGLILAKFFNSILNANGDTKAYRNYLIISFLLNLILNPILIFEPFNLGVKGIAFSTILIQFLGAMYLFQVCRKNSFIAFEDFKTNLIPDFKIISEILYQAIPAFMNMFAVSIGFFVSTYYVGQFGQNAVAAYGVAVRIEQVFLLPAIGLNIAGLAMVSQNNGAKLYQRVKESFFICQKYALLLMLFGGAITFYFSRELTLIFTNNTEIVEISSYFLKLESLVFFAYSSIYVSISVLQGLKQPLFVVWLGLFRQVVLPFSAMYLCIDVYGYGLKSVWWSRFFVVIVASKFTYFYVRRQLGRLPENLTESTT